MKDKANIELEENFKLLEEDKVNLDRYFVSAPPLTEILAALDKWQIQKHHQQKRQASKTNSAIYFLFSKIGEALLFLLTIGGAWLELRNHFDYQGLIFDYNNTIWLALGLLTVQIFLILLVFKHAPLHTLFATKMRSSQPSVVRFNLVKTIAAKIFALLEIAGLGLATLTAGPLSYYLYHTGLTQIQLTYVGLLLLIVIAWIVLQAYFRYHVPYQSFQEWLAMALQAGVRSRKQRLLVVVTALFVVAVLTPLVLTLLQNEDLTYSQEGWGQLAVADNEDLSLPPDNMGNGPFGKGTFVLTSNTNLVATPPATMPVYRQIMQNWTVDDALAFAKNLDFDPTTMQQNNFTDAYIFNRPDHARLILSRKVKGIWSYNSDAVQSELTLPGKNINFAGSIDHKQAISRREAEKVAIDFLQKGQLFNLQYQEVSISTYFDTLSPQDETQGLGLKFVQILNGQPVYGPATQVTVSGDGKVLAVTSNVLPLEKRGDYALENQQQILEKLNDGSLPLDEWQKKYENGSAGNNTARTGTSGICPFNLTQPIEPTNNQTEPKYQLGQTIDVTGNFSAIIYRSEDRQHPDHHVTSLSTNLQNTFYTFYLEGAKVPDMIKFDTYQMHVRGKVTAVVPQVSKGYCGQQPATQHTTYKLEVTSFSKEPANQERVKFLGQSIFQKLGSREYQVFVDENGSRYIDQTFEDILKSEPDPQAFINRFKLQDQLVANQLGGKMELATQLQTTGQTIEGVAVAKIVSGSVTEPNNSRDNAPAHRPTIIPMPKPDIPEGSSIQVNEVQLGYYAHGLDVQDNLPSNSSDTLARPSYRFFGEWNMKDSNKLAGYLEVTVPAFDLLTTVSYFYY